MRADGLSSYGQASLLTQALASGTQAPPQGALRAVLVGLVRLDAVRVCFVWACAPRALVDGGNSMNHDQQTALSIIRNLLAICSRFETKAGHLDFREDIDHRGVCRQRRHYVGGIRVKDGTGFRMAEQTLDGTCADSCREFVAAVTAAREHVAANAVAQLSLIGEVA